MIIYLILFLIAIIIQILILGILFSKLELNIEECDISYNIDIPGKIKIKNLKLNIKLYLFKKINILKIKIYKNYCEIFNIKVNFNILKKIKEDEPNKLIYALKNIRMLKLEITNINLEIGVGTESTMVTTFLIPTISTAAFVFISKYMKENTNIKSKNLQNNNLKIIPRYTNTNNFTINGTAQICFDTTNTLFFVKNYRKVEA